MTDLNVDQIQARQISAQALLDGNLEPDADYDRADGDLRQLVGENVNALLLALEEAACASDAGYLRGLRAAASWLRTWDQPLPDFDQATCRNLARGLRAMADSAANRLGVDAEGEHSTPDDRAAADAVWTGVR
jgi:hypothetical protein